MEVVYSQSRLRATPLGFVKNPPVAGLRVYESLIVVYGTVVLEVSQYPH